MEIKFNAIKVKKLNSVFFKDLDCIIGYWLFLIE